MDEYMTLEEFRQYYREFELTPDPNVQFYLDSAQYKVNKEVFRELSKMAHGNYTAHLLASSPFGQNLKLQNPDGRTDYLAAFEQLLKSVAPTVYVCNSDSVISFY